MKTLLGQTFREPLSLSADERLASLVERVSTLPVGDPYTSCRQLMGMLDEAFHGVGASVGFVVRSGEESTERVPGRVFGWTPGLFLYGEGDQHRVEMTQELLRGREFARDDGMREKMREAGHVRLFACREFDEHSPPPPGFEGAIFRRLSLVDRMTVHVPLAADVEAVVMVDRRLPPVFSREDAALLLTIQRFLGGLLRGLARACGYIDASSSLTPRERDVVRLLLSGEREKDIAHTLSMTPSALHQRVKEIYSKYQVTSRPELMSLWLNSRLADKNRRMTEEI